LEINTKSYQNFNGRQASLDKNVLLRYREMGGEIISFGSDSHYLEHVGLEFEKYAAIVKSLGFKWTAHYEKRKLVQLPL
jgi:histidinol-phosphatase (PHP family)